MDREGEQEDKDKGGEKNEEEELRAHLLRERREEVRRSLRTLRGRGLVSCAAGGW